MGLVPCPKCVRINTRSFKYSQCLNHHTQKWCHTIRTRVFWFDLLVRGLSLELMPFGWALAKPGHDLITRGGGVGACDLAPTGNPTKFNLILIPYDNYFEPSR